MLIAIGLCDLLWCAELCSSSLVGRLSSPKGEDHPTYVCRQDEPVSWKFSASRNFLRCRVLQGQRQTEQTRTKETA
jgi:hypothetical protein